MDDLEKGSSAERDTWAFWIGLLAMALSIVWVSLQGSTPAIATASGGDKGARAFTRVDASGDEPLHVTTLAGTSQGVVAGTKTKSVRPLYGSSAAIASSLPPTITALLATDLGLWVGAGSEGLFLASYVSPQGLGPPVVQRFKVPTPTGHPEITALASGMGRLWVGTSSGLYSLDFSRWYSYQPPTRFGPPLGPAPVTALYADARGTIWVGTEVGLFAYNGSETFRYGKKDGLWSDAISSLSGDEGQTLLIGTDQGLVTYKAGIFVRDGVIRERVVALLAARPQPSERELWVATPTRLWTKKGHTPFTPIEAQTVTGLPDTQHTALAWGPDGLHVGSTVGVYRHTPTHQTSAEAAGPH